MKIKGLFLPKNHQIYVPCRTFLHSVLSYRLDNLHTYLNLANICSSNTFSLFENEVCYLSLP